MSKQSSLVETMLVPHSAFARAQAQIELAFKHASNQSEAQGIAIVGESGTGKTSLIDHFYAQYPSQREADGMRIPILRVSVPSTPTIKSLAAVMLHGMMEPQSDRGTANQRTEQILTLMERTGVRMVMLDEFQHCYDKSKRCFTFDVADWLKLLMDEARFVLIVAGLPSCMDVIEHNEQLQRRFLSPLQMPRFNWDNSEDREEFVGILEAFNERLSTKFHLPKLHSDLMAFRFYCATGGLISLVSKILRQAERKASTASIEDITLETLDEAHRESIWMREGSSECLRPFDRGFNPVQSVKLVSHAKTINMRAACESRPATIRATRRSESVHSLLSKKPK